MLCVIVNQSRRRGRGRLVSQEEWSVFFLHGDPFLAKEEFMIYGAVIFNGGIIPLFFCITFWMLFNDRNNFLGHFERIWVLQLGGLFRNIVRATHIRFSLNLSSCNSIWEKMWLFHLRILK